MNKYETTWYAKLYFYLMNSESFLVTTVQLWSKAYPKKNCNLKNRKAVTQLLLNCGLYMERLKFVLGVSEVLQLVQNTNVGLRLVWFVCLWYCYERYGKSSSKCALDNGYKDTACCSFTTDSEI